jgi:[ribosomal protein S5]-alanine N-acetyltransferase
MLEINFDTFPLLQTNRLVLRPLEDTDAEALFNLRSNAQVMRYFGRPLMQSIDEAHEKLAQIKIMFANNDGVEWAMSFHDDPQMIGSLTIWKIDKTNHRGEIGYMLHPEHQGKGLMSEALQALIQYGFEVLNLHSLEANVNPDNTASSQLLVRNGFVREAYFRENFYFDGKFEDSAIYSLLCHHKGTSGIFSS